MNQILAKKLDRILKNNNARARKYGLPPLHKVDLMILIEQSGMICCYCQRQLRVYEDNRIFKDAISIDHKTAMGLGGSNEISNIAICCHECNDKKNWSEAPKAMENNRKMAGLNGAVQGEVPAYAGIDWIE